MAKVSVIGAGSWGTALATVLARNGHEVTIWSIMEEEIAMLKEKREHVTKLPGVKLSEEIGLTTNLEEAVEGRELLVLAVPSVFTRGTAKKHAAFCKGRAASCQRGERHRREDFDGFERYNKRRDSTGKSSCVVRTQPCRGGGQETPYNLRGGS